MTNEVHVLSAMTASARFADVCRKMPKVSNADEAVTFWFGRSKKDFEPY